MRRVAKYLLIATLLILLLADGCIILWGGEGALTQDQRVGAFLLGIVTLLGLIRAEVE